MVYGKKRRLLIVGAILGDIAIATIVCIGILKLWYT